MRRRGRIGVYGKKTRRLQRRLSFESFGLTFKDALVWRYLGSREKEVPSIDDVQCMVFWEVPERAYSSDVIAIPVGVEMAPEVKTDFSRMGLINPLQDETIFRFHIDDFRSLERTMIVGDVFEIPFFTDEHMKSMWEVVDVDLRSMAEKFIAVVHAVPLGESKKTREIPVDNGARDLMDGLMGDFDEQVSEILPAAELDFDIPAVQDVDFRDEKQRGFLDDPTKEF